MIKVELSSENENFGKLESAAVSLRASYLEDSSAKISTDRNKCRVFIPDNIWKRCGTECPHVPHTRACHREQNRPMDINVTD